MATSDSWRVEFSKLSGVRGFGPTVQRAGASRLRVFTSGIRETYAAWPKSATGASMAWFTVPTRMQTQQRLCSECGEPIGPKRLQAVPDAQQCFDCANQGAGVAPVVAPRKSLPSKPIVTTHHLKRYLMNVGQKTDPKALFRTLVRVNYLFPHISAAEMTPIFIHWSQQTNSPFDQAQVTQLVLDAKQWVKDHPNKVG